MILWKPQAGCAARGFHILAFRQLMSFASVSSCEDYFVDFLRVAKNRPAATTMMAHPPMVKIVVPMPPV